MAVSAAARILAAAIACLCALAGAARAEEARVAVASNVLAAAQDIADAFEAQGRGDISLVGGSTGKLYAQILAGAPFDAFLAADEDRPRLLEERGMAVAGSRFAYAAGTLALWSPGGAAPREKLLAGDFRRLALANADLAPYGRAATQTLRALGVDDAAAGKLAYGEDVGQAFAFARTGNADLAFVALSQILALPPDERGAVWVVDGLHEPVRQDAVLLERAADNETARAFLAFLRSPDAARILEATGYGAPGR